MQRSVSWDNMRLSCLDAPSQLLLLAGAGARPDHPLADLVGSQNSTLALSRVADNAYRIVSRPASCTLEGAGMLVILFIRAYSYSLSGYRGLVGIVWDVLP